MILGLDWTTNLLWFVLVGHSDCTYGPTPLTSFNQVVLYQCFLKNGQIPASFHLFLVFSNKQYNFYYKSMCKNLQMSIQYTVQGFEPTTFGTWVSSSVTRSGDLLDFGQLFKAFGNNQFAQISHILRQFLWRCKNKSYF